LSYLNFSDTVAGRKYSVRICRSEWNACCSIPGSQPRSQLKEKSVQALEDRRRQRRFSCNHNYYHIAVYVVSISAYVSDLLPSPSLGLCVGLSVWKVYCGKMAHWIQMPFVMVSGVGRGMGVLNGVGYHRIGRGSFGVEFWAPLYPKGNLLHSCAKCVQRTSCRLAL